MPSMQWSYSLAIRATSSTRSVVGQYYAGTLAAGMVGNVMAIPTAIGPPTYEKVELQREGFDYAQQPLVISFRPRLVVRWEQRADEVLGLAGNANLRDVLSFVTTVGSWLEVSLDGGTHWRPCNLASSSINYEKIDGKAVGVVLELEFSGRRLVPDVPNASAGVEGWGESGGIEIG